MLTISRRKIYQQLLTQFRFYCSQNIQEKNHQIQDNKNDQNSTFQKQSPNPKIINWLTNNFNLWQNDIEKNRSLKKLCYKNLDTIQNNFDLLVNQLDLNDEEKYNLIIKHNHFLYVDEDEIKNRLEFWCGKINCEQSVIKQNIQILGYSNQVSEERLEFLNQLKFDAIQMFQNFPSIIYQKPEMIKQRIDELYQTLEVAQNQIINSIQKQPKILTTGQQNGIKIIRFLKIKKWDPEFILEFIQKSPFLLQLNIQNVVQNWEEFIQIGLDEDDILQCIHKEPEILKQKLSSQTIQLKLRFAEIFLRHKSRDLIREFPKFLSYSLEQRIAPRIIFMQNKGIQIPLNIAKILQITDFEFAKRIVQVDPKIYRQQYLKLEFVQRDWPKVLSQIQGGKNEAAEEAAEEGW